MSTKFTPGPWEYDGNGRVDAVEFRKPTGHICEDGSEYIGGLVALPYHCGGATHEANARLIAAAPEMFAVLEKLLEEGATVEVRTNARAVVAKALGEVEQADRIAEAA